MGTTGLRRRKLELRQERRQMRGSSHGTRSHPILPVRLEPSLLPGTRSPQASPLRPAPTLRAGDDVLELADVARPMMGLDLIERVLPDRHRFCAIATTFRL